jgi:hypothetical protein
MKRPVKETWDTIRRWLVAASGAIAFFISIAAFLKTSEQEDDVRAVIDPRIDTEKDFVSFSNDLLIAGDITFINSGNRSAAIREMKLLFYDNPHRKIENCEGFGMVLDLDFTSFVLSSNSVAVKPLIRRVGDRYSGTNHEPNAKEMFWLACLQISVITPDDGIIPSR